MNHRDLVVGHVDALRAQVALCALTPRIGGVDCLLDGNKFLEKRDVNDDTASGHVHRSVASDNSALDELAADEELFKHGACEFRADDQVVEERSNPKAHHQYEQGSPWVPD